MGGFVSLSQFVALKFSVISDAVKTTMFLKLSHPNPMNSLSAGLTHLSSAPTSLSPVWFLLSFQPWVFGFCPRPILLENICLFFATIPLLHHQVSALMLRLQMHNPSLLQISLRPEIPGVQQWVDVILSPNTFSSFSSLGTYSAVIGT